ncbi:unnamed protein product [Toxocara canis]|uniref:Uncharacterized protein n=1 Tax=Toxocara canis TaxID=6265 RepID=A0A183U8M1_TOXCA|nr:unnamed protein product [Toxocara canis]
MEQTKGTRTKFVTTNQSQSTGMFTSQYGEPRSATFASLPALVRYHKIYSYMDPKTGVIDTSPV